MDMVLVSVTGVSLTLAAAMGFLLMRMMREERLRSDARVQLLEELAGAEEPRGPGRTEALRYKDTPVRVVPAAAPAPVAQDFSPVSVKRSRSVVDLPLREVEAKPVEITGVHDLFHEEHEPSPWPRRFAVIGGIALVVTLAGFGWTQMSGTTAAPPAAAAAPDASAALELLSLRHTREGNTLTVTGLVQNPKTGASLSNVQATLFVFGPGGTFITSGRVPLDYTSLTPGDESPFVIRVPVTGDVSRYRVGFRGQDDRVVAHVDRRNEQVGRNTF